VAIKLPAGLAILRINMRYYLSGMLLILLVSGCKLCAMNPQKATVAKEIKIKVLPVDKNSLKVNSQGKYITFPGVTIVSDVAVVDRPFFKALYDNLSRISDIRKYYALLPIESYHMTTNNIMTKSDPNWPDVINKKLAWFKKLHVSLQKEAIKPGVTFEKIKTHKTIGIILKLSEEQTRQIKSFGKKFNIEKKIPPAFHITLAYLYKDIPEVERIKLEEEVAKRLNQLLTKYQYTKKVWQLEPASLRYFNTMSQFIPWNAEANPFGTIK